LGYINELTERLYYHDSYLWKFDATVSFRSDDGLRIQLDRSAFYPSSGGQPFDTGTISGIDVVDVIDEDDHITHVLRSPLGADCQLVAGSIDVARRLDHMRQHTGQHVLSAVLEEEFGLKTVSFHMGAGYATIDIEPMGVSASKLLEIERRVNERLLENSHVSVAFEHSSTVVGLRKAPDREGLLRVVTIAELDRSACGGTHVARTGEVGMILFGKTEKVRQALRLEFFCGGRVLEEVHRRSNDAESQSTALRERLAESDKVRKRLAAEVAEIAGQQRYAQSLADSRGRFTWIEEMETVDEDTRMRANAFLNNENALVILTGRSGATVLFGAHPGLGIDCGKTFKSLISEFGGKGGGSAKQAQGSLPDLAVLRLLVERLMN
jgi:alanyl-tRNA synthetase